MHHKNLVAVIRANGTVLREHNDSVQLPFNSDYEILLKNLAKVSAFIQLEVDGVPFDNNKGFVLKAGETRIIKGFPNPNGEDYAFRFIEKTQRIRSNREDTLCDGLISFHYSFCDSQGIRKAIQDLLPDKPQSPQPWTHPSIPQWPQPGVLPSSPWDQNPIVYGSGPTAQLSASAEGSYTSPVNNTDGFTTRGPFTGEHTALNNKPMGLAPEFYTMTLQLCGIHSSGSVVSDPIGVKTKIPCPVCKKKHKSSASFCSRCGTNLQ